MIWLLVFIFTYTYSWNMLTLCICLQLARHNTMRTETWYWPITIELNFLFANENWAFPSTKTFAEKTNAPEVQHMGEEALV